MPELQKLQVFWIFWQERRRNKTTGIEAEGGQIFKVT